MAIIKSTNNTLILILNDVEYNDIFLQFQMKNLLKLNILSIMEIVKYQLKSQQAPNDDK